MRTSVLSALIGAGCLLMANADPAAAQAARTWVSGVGDDVNPCSRTAPCKTFAGAISKTAAGGEINCIDPGGFGTVTITKSMTIDCGGTFGSILSASTNGINVNGSNIIVAIRNLSISGGGAGLIGINFINGLSLQVENVNIFGFNAGTALGIKFAPSAANSFLQVINSRITSNGISPSTGGGIDIGPAVGGSALVVISDTELEGNAIGLASGSSAGGIKLTVRDSVIGNNRSFGVLAAGANSNVVMLERATVSNNLTTGILTNGAGVTLRIGNSVVTGNATGVSAVGGSTLRSYKNNAINGNTTEGTPITQENLN